MKKGRWRQKKEKERESACSFCMSFAPRFHVLFYLPKPRTCKTPNWIPSLPALPSRFLRPYDSPHLCPASPARFCIEIDHSSSLRQRRGKARQRHSHYTHLNARDLLRIELKSGSENGTMIQNMIKEGKIVSCWGHN